MRILHATTQDVAGGASMAAMRLHGALLAQGSDSRVAVLAKEGEAPNVSLLGGKLSRRVLRPLVLRLEDNLLDAVYSRPQYPAHTTFSVTPSWNHARLNVLPKDILHLHWVGEGFLTPFSLGRLCGPVVWTMHDTFPFTGGCHFTSTGCTRYRGMCGHCPELGSSTAADISRLHWWWKRRAIRRIRPFIVSPSREYAERARQSGMLGDCPVEVIPNGLDVNAFRPIPREQARALLGLPQDGKLLLFGALLATGDSNKGFDLLLDALHRLRGMGMADFSAVVFGSATLGTTLPCPVHVLGRLHDTVTLALAYSAADVFVCPSRQENFPNTVMEAMACGTPVAAFSVGGLPDLVEDGVTGLLAAPADAASLAHAIARIVNEPAAAARMAGAARRKAVGEYSLPVLARRYADLYERVLEQRRGGGQNVV
ncbi:glycosyltransferase [Nitratidesulfovibrio termitidis]|uniref:glycosyltransferase n=1 Tax=Nitratidesulfovibrio termitidis TaxID=42252 RepID=UPI0003F5057C|nr:glycosyltransferase [Nitratidesulfovibrio termitidis]